MLIHDAGGEYFWRDGGSSSYVRPHYETVLHASNDALFWIGGPDRVPSHTALVADDPRFAHMRPVRERRVHALDRNGLGTWTYPWVDQSLDRPDAILADLIGVLHPELGVEAAPAYIRALE